MLLLDIRIIFVMQFGWWRADIYCPRRDTDRLKLCLATPTMMFSSDKRAAYVCTGTTYGIPQKRGTQVGFSSW